jgi:hypothetical protein
MHLVDCFLLWVECNLPQSQQSVHGSLGLGSISTFLSQFLSPSYRLQATVHLVTYVGIADGSFMIPHYDFAIWLLEKFPCTSFCYVLLSKRDCLG